jgi:hemerythrin-like domain-containing protein
MPRANMTEHQQVGLNNHFNIIEILLLDHSYLKECIKMLKNRNEDKKVKLRYAKSFLDTLKKHSAGEKKALYAPLLEVKELRTIVLESEVEHGIIDFKVKTLTSKMSSVRVMNEQIEAEMKVLAEIVENHINEEESVMFPKMRQRMDNTILNEMGFQFMVFRQFTSKDLQYNPELKEEVPFIKKSHPITTSKYLSRAHNYFNGQSTLQ